MKILFSLYTPVEKKGKTKYGDRATFKLSHLYHSFLQSFSTPQTSHLASRQYNIQNSPCPWSFHTATALLSKSKEFSSQGMIAQVKRAFKSYHFLLQKNCKKVTNLCIKLSLTPIQVFPGTSPPFSALPILSTRSACPGQDQQYSQQSIDYYPSPSGLTLKMHPFNFQRFPRLCLSSKYFLLNFLSKLYKHTLVAENFQIYAVQITGKCICKSKKLSLDIFTQVPTQISPTGSCHHPKTEQNYSLPPGSVFSKIYSPISKKSHSFRWMKLCKASPRTHRFLWSSFPTTDPKKAVILVTPDPYRCCQMPRDTLGRISVINFDNDPQKSKNEALKIKWFEYKTVYIHLNLIGKFPAKKLKLNVKVVFWLLHIYLNFLVIGPHQFALLAIFHVSYDHVLTKMI